MTSRSSLLGTIPPLGLGGAYLTAGFEKSRNVRLVELAFDVGFRHFDVAPQYGIGTAEDVLGLALAGHREHCTIASKVGIPRPTFPAHVMLARALAKPLRALVPTLTQRQGQRLVERSSSERRYDIEFIDSSLTESLRRLRTDYLDVFLLHEAGPQDISDGVLALLERRRAQGLIRAFGIAGSYEAALSAPRSFDVVQYSWNALNGVVRSPPKGRVSITHRALNPLLGVLQSALASDKIVLERLSRLTQVDLAEPAVLSDILIGAALAANPEGIVLVASRREARIKSASKLFHSVEAREAGHRFTSALAEEAGFTAKVRDLLATQLQSI